MWDASAAWGPGPAGFGLTWLAQSSALLGLGLLAGRLLRGSGPAVQSGLYRTTLAAVLICPIASALLGAAGVPGLALRFPAPSAEVKAGPVSASPAPWTRETRAEGPGMAAEVAPLPPAGVRVSASSTAERPTTGPAPPRAPARAWAFPTAGAIGLGLAVWGLGSLVLGARLLVGQARMARLRASAVPAGAGAEALCRDLAGRMRVGAPAVLRSPYLFSPCLDGLRRPAILLPDDAVENLRETFVHELAHLARRDGLWNLLRRSAVAALWVQPLLWVLSRRLEAAAEDVCDDYVVQFGADRARYAGHLLELAGRALPPASPAGVGMVSLRSMLARRVVRILDTSRGLSTRAGARAVAAMLTLGLAGTLLAGLLGVGAARREARAQTPNEAKGGVTRGRVVGPDGAPVAGATVVASRSRRVLDGIGDDYRLDLRYEIARTTADRDGRFEVSLPAPEDDPRTAGDLQILATAPGFGLGYRLGGQPIRLGPGDLPIAGRLVDLEGRPAAGVNVRLGQVWVAAPGVAPGAVSKEEPGSMGGRLGLDAAPLWPDGVTTDRDGRFRFAGLGRDTLAELTVSGPKVATKRVRVVTRVMGRVADEPRDPAFVGIDEAAVYGAEAAIPVEPTRPIEGVVSDLVTKEPIPGAVVTAAALSGSTLTIDGLISAETDARGRYRLLGLPKEGKAGHSLAVYPPLDRPYFTTRRIEAPATPGMEPVRCDIRLRRGIWVTGRVTDLATGKPVRAAVDYFPFLNNARAKDYPNFDPNVSASIAIKTRYRTDEDGRFRVVGLPGGGVVTAHTEDRSYRTGVGAEAITGRTSRDQLLTYDHIFPSLYQGLKEVNVPEGLGSFGCDLGLDPGGTVLVRLVDEAGAPVTDGATASGRFPAGADAGDSSVYGGVARVGGLVEGEKRVLMVRHAERKIGAVVAVTPPGAKGVGELTLALGPGATLTGRLVDAKGKPAAGGVRVDLVGDGSSFFGSAHVTDGALDREGRFRCEVVPAGGPYQVVATNRLVYGFGPKQEPEDFAQFALATDLKVEPGQAVDLGTFDVTSQKRVDVPPPAPKAGAADVPVNGRIVDLEGRPVAGVSVKVGGVRGSKAGDVSAWIDGVKKGEPPWIAYKHLDDDVELRPKATTDRDGRFRFEGLGGERVVGLSIEGDAVAYTTIDVVTRKTEPFAAKGFANSHGPGSQTVYGADFTFTATPGRPVEGVVKDAKSGKPLAGAEVRSYRFAGSDFVGIMALKTRADAQGRFRLTGLPKGKGNMLIVVPNDDQPYLLQEVEVPDPPGGEPVAVDLPMHRGVWIGGKLTERATGKPVAGAWLHYLPFLKNTFAQALPEFDKNGNTHGVGLQDRYKTGADGRFRLVGLPGPAIVGAVVHGKTFLQGFSAEPIAGMNKAGHYETFRNPVNPGRFWPTVMAAIDPPADADAVRVDLQVVTGASVRLKVVDAEGKPVAGLKTSGRTGRGVHDGEGLTGGVGAVTNLGPDEERVVVVRHEGRTLGKALRVRAGDDAKGPVVLTLEPLAAMTGRVTEADGTPVPGATVRPDALPGGDFSLSLPQVVTDAGGRFRVSDLPAGCDYALAVETTREIKNRRFTFLERAAVTPGETTDVGEIRFKND